MHIIRRCSLLILLSFTLASCGSGGGDSSEPATSAPVSSSTGSATIPTVPADAMRMSLSTSNISHAGEILRKEIYDPVSVFEGVRSNYTIPMPEFSASNGSNTLSCTNGGSVVITVSGNGATVSRDFKNCFISAIHRANGRFTHSISDVNQAAQAYTMNVSYDNYVETYNSESITYNGTTRIDAQFDNQNYVYLDVESRRVINSSEVGEVFTASPLSYSLNYSLFDTSKLVVEAVNGTIQLAQSGAIDYSWLDSEQRVLISGNGSEKGYFKIDQTGYALEYVDSGGDSYGVKVENGIESNVFGGNVAPVFYYYYSSDVNKDEATVFNFANWFSDDNLDVLAVTISEISVPEGANYEFSETQNFSSVFTSDTEGDYVFKLRAVDPDGLSAEGTINFRVIVDTDGDGNINAYDYDDDNDGVNDEDDAFPLDNSESADTDGDGIGDNADTDDDNDGVIDTSDLFPKDAQCSVASQSVGGRCISVVVAESDEIAIDEASGIVYVLAKAENIIVRWSTEESRFMDSIELGGATPSSATAVQMALSVAHNRLYFGYDTGSITYLSLAGGSETSLVNLPLEVGGLVAVGEFIMAQDDSGAWSTHYTIDINGSIKDQEEWNYASDVYRWDAQYQRVYYFSHHSPRDLHYEEIDPLTGEISSSGETPYHGDYSLVAPIIVSEADGSVLLGSGNIFSQPELNWVGAVPGDIVDGIWSLDGLIVIRTVGDKTVLERRNDELVVVEQVEYEGAAKALVHTVNGYTVFTTKANGLLASSYVPSADTDGDMVLNGEDDFPLDIAASLDTDYDGYPDAWNAGYSQSDSTTGLSLDAYPADAACHLLSQGDGTSCDYSQVIPVFTPDKVINDENGIIYMLSSDNNRVYRWSMAANDYIAPIVIGDDAPIGATKPTLMEYSAPHNRLYFGYDSGQVNYLDLNDLSSGEQPYATVSMDVRGIAAVGNYVMVQDNSGAWATHYVFSKAGDLTDSKDWNRYSRVYAWSDELSRVYFFRDATSPNDLHYEEIDQNTGKIVAEGESPYHGDYGVSPPILVTSTNSVVLGNGDIYNARSLEWKGALSSDFEHGVLLGNGELLTIRTLAGNTRLDHYSSVMSWTSEKDYVGLPVGIFEKDGTAYIVTKTDLGLSFYQY